MLLYVECISPFSAGLLIPVWLDTQVWYSDMQQIVYCRGWLVQAAVDCCNGPKHPWHWCVQEALTRQKVYKPLLFWLLLLIFEQTFAHNFECFQWNLFGYWWAWFVASFISCNASTENVVNNVVFCCWSEKVCSKLPQFISILMTTFAVLFCIRMRGLKGNFFSVVHVVKQLYCWLWLPQFGSAPFHRGVTNDIVICVGPVSL
jgi:hypothetical protein